jgi:hypothetical protein
MDFSASEKLQTLVGRIDALWTSNSFPWSRSSLYETDRAILAFLYRHERAARIYNGADEAHKISAAKQILKHYV